MSSADPEAKNIGHKLGIRRVARPQTGIGAEGEKNEGAARYSDALDLES
jgi:hypothetical protein